MKWRVSFARNIQKKTAEKTHQQWMQIPFMTSEKMVAWSMVLVAESFVLKVFKASKMAPKMIEYAKHTTKES